MKTQGRSDNGGHIPPSHDDYDDYDDIESSAEDTLEVSSLDDDYADEPIEEAPPPPRRGSARPGANGSGNGNGHTAPPQGGTGSRMRPPSNVGRPPAATLPKRRPRTDMPDADGSVVPAPPSSPATKPQTGNGKRNGSNGAVGTAVQAPVAQASRPTRPAPTVPTSVAVDASAPAPETLAVRMSRMVFTYETLIFMIIFAIAIFSRFWDLGNRGIHHDESLHAVFSRTLYIGGGYTHDPMMHGPIQFNLIASMYWLFGTSDATARFASAFCGIWVVMCPFFLRRQIGHWPAIIASFLLLVAPGILYFSRMAREDSIFSAMEMIMVVGLWRFVSMRKPADFFIFCTGLSLMFTIKESAYLTVAVLGIMFALLFAFQAGYAVLGTFFGYGAGMGAMYLLINGQIKAGQIPKLPDIPAQNPDYTTITTFAGNLIGHPLIQYAVILTILFLGVLIFIFQRQRRQIAMMEPEYDYDMEEAPVRSARPTRPASRSQQAALPTRRSRVIAPVAEEGPIDVAASTTNGHSEEEMIPATVSAEYDQYESDEATEVWDPKRLDPKPGTLLAHYEPGSIPHLIGALFSRPSVLLIGFIIAATIFVVFYSVFFTDLPRGIASGLFASLGYWMAQQGVARGGQPWYYYFVIIPLYQPIAVFFSLVAGTFFTVKGIKGFLRNREDRRYSNTYEPGLGAFNTDRPVPFAKFSVFLPLFAIWWLSGEVFIYSWAGEKMPWLIMHMIRPAIFLSSLFLGALVASIITRRNERVAWEREYYGEEVGAPTTPLVPQGRRQRAGSYGFRIPGMSPNLALATAGAQASGAPSNDVNFAYAQARRRPGSGGGSGRGAVQAYIYEQEPPWETWNRAGSKFPALSFLTIFTLLGLAWGLKLNALSSASDYNGWGYSWVYPVLMLILIVSYSVWLGPSRVLRYAALAVFSLFFLYEVKSAINLTYQHPDVPTELAVYVQTSPDVTRNVKELNDYSMYTTGGTTLPVVYNWFASWPYSWYLRDFKNARFIDRADPAPNPADVPIFIVDYGSFNSSVVDGKVQDAQSQVDTIQGQIDDLNSQPQSAERDAQITSLQGTLQAQQTTLNNWKHLRDDYVLQRYAMRWWFPEDWYKKDLIQGQDTTTAPLGNQVGAIIGTTAGTITNPAMTSTLWKYLMFRQTPQPLGSEDMIVGIRRDIMQTYHYLQYEPPTFTDTPPATVRTPPPSDGSWYR